MFKFLKDLIAPKKCYSCNKEWHFLCEDCLSKMSNFESICYVCKGKSDNFEIHNKCLVNIYYDKIIILSHYKNNIISKLIKDLKFYGKKDIAEEFWNYLSELFFENEIYKNTDNYPAEIASISKIQTPLVPTILKSAVNKEPKKAPASPVYNESDTSGLQLTGIIHGEGDSMAIINGSVYMAGDMIGNTRVLSITGDAVTVEDNTKVLKLKVK